MISRRRSEKARACRRDTARDRGVPDGDRLRDTAGSQPACGAPRHRSTSSSCQRRRSSIARCRATRTSGSIVDAALAPSHREAVKLVTDGLRDSMRLREYFPPFDNPEGCDFEARIEHLQPWVDRTARALQHAHAFHMRYYYSALAANQLERVALNTGESTARSIDSRPASITKSSTATRTTPTWKPVRSAAGPAITAGGPATWWSSSTIRSGWSCS